MDITLYRYGMKVILGVGIEIFLQEKIFETPLISNS